MVLTTREGETSEGRINGGRFLAAAAAQHLDESNEEGNDHQQKTNPVNALHRLVIVYKNTIDT